MTIAELLVEDSLNSFAIGATNGSCSTAILNIVSRVTLYNTMVLIQGEENVFLHPSCTNQLPRQTIASSSASYLLQDSRLTILVAFLRSHFVQTVLVGKLGLIVICVHIDRDIGLLVERLSQLLPSSVSERIVKITGHGNILEYAKKWNAVIHAASIAIVSQGVLLALCNGLVRLADIKAMVFDDCTAANNSHPYCILMQHFYAVDMARDIRAVTNGELEMDKAGTKLPRILGFATWPKCSIGEDCLAKRTRLSKLSQYTRLFHSVIVPYLISPNDQNDVSNNTGCTYYMPVEEFDSISENGLFNQLQVVALKSGHGLIGDRIEATLDMLQALVSVPTSTCCHLVMVNLANVETWQSSLSQEFANHLPYTLVRLEDGDSVRFKNFQHLVFLATNDQADLVALLLKEAELSQIILAEPIIDPSIMFTLLNHAKKVSICTLRESNGYETREQALEISLWLVITSVLALESNDSGKQLRSLLGYWEFISKAGYLLNDRSSLHFRVPSTGALCMPAVSASMLSCFQSYLPQLGDLSKLDLCTMMVKRVDNHGKVLDKDRCYFMTRVTLAPCMESWIAKQIVEETVRQAGLCQAIDKISLQKGLTITGPLTTSRFASQALASLQVMETLWKYKCITDNLAPSQIFLNSLPKQSDQSKLQAIPNDALETMVNFGNILEEKEAEVEGNSKFGLIPKAFQYESVEPAKLFETVHVYILEYSLDYKQQDTCNDERLHAKRPFVCLSAHDETNNVNLDNDYIGSNHDNLPLKHHSFPSNSTIDARQIITPTKIPPDTLVFQSEMDIFNGTNLDYGYGLLTRNELEDGLKTIEIPLGTSLVIKARPKRVTTLQLTVEQIEALLAVQAVIFGAINLHQIIPQSVDDNVASELGENDATSLLDKGQSLMHIPPEKRVIYLIAFLKSKSAPSLSDIAATNGDLEGFYRVEKLYAKFTYMCANLPKTCCELSPSKGPSKLANIEWEIDWKLINSLLDPNSFTNCLSYLEAVENFSKVHQDRLSGYMAPHFSSLKDPLKSPTIIDYQGFALRRLLLYAPYNGMFYRSKKMCTDLRPASSFKSKSFPNCKTYADYLRHRYGMVIQRPDSQPLVAAKRVDNHGQLIKWLSRHLEEIGKSGSGMRGSQQDNNFQAVLIPEVIKIVPIPYVMIRMALLLPRTIFEIERQSIIIDFYREKLKIHPSIRPSPAVCVESLTSPSASLSYDYERLEILGDSLLKLWVTIDVYLHNDNCREGILSRRRETIVNNANLHRIASSLNVIQYARFVPFLPKLWTGADLGGMFSKEAIARWPFIPFLFDKGERRYSLLWAADERTRNRQTLFHLYPDGRLINARKVSSLTAKKSSGRKPSINVASANNRKSAGSKTLTSNLPQAFPEEDRVENDKGTQLHGLLIPPKTLADLIESIIGASYMSSGGLMASFEFMKSIGLVRASTLELIKSPPETIVTCLADQAAKSTTRASIDSSPKQADSQVAGSLDPDHFPYEAIESILGHRFVHRQLLFIAFTHASVDSVYNYERFEWLGDAALDWLATLYLYNNFTDVKFMTPGRITEGRKAVVCNEAFSKMCVYLKLLSYMRIKSPHLQAKLDAYAKALMERDKALNLFEKCTEANRKDSHRIPLPPAPKTLGDLFEAIAGAVFIDVGFDVEQFRKIYLPILQWHLDTRCDPYNLPNDPVSDFWHIFRSARIPSHAISFEYDIILHQIMAGRFVAPLGKTLAKEDTIYSESGVSVECIISVRGRSIADGIGSNRLLARKEAMRAAVKYMEGVGWRELM